MTGEEVVEEQAVPTATTPEGPGAPAGATPGVSGWYSDPWSSSRQRWWTGESWTFSTDEALATKPVVNDATPDVVPPTPGPPAPVPPRPPVPPQPGAPVGVSTGRTRRLAGLSLVAVALLVVGGLVVGLLSVGFLRHRLAPTSTAGSSATGRGPAGAVRPPGATASPSTNNDPSASALSSLIVKPDDVPSLTVVLLPGGAGLSQPTLDLCNGTFASESERTARLQDAVIDAEGKVTFSTEAVLYHEGGAAQAFSEIKAVAAACPATLVDSPVGEPTVTTRFNPPPDGDWPQTATVNRLAYDITTTDESGQTDHMIVVYLQRGRALMGVYFADADKPPAAVAGQTTVAGIVGVFAGRMAALPASVVSS